ncbi:MAG TPA: shikimate kinase [Euryarchaeota archaeon]|nr:shikimate kinase [Euryarchaeota archaeon]
MKNIVLTGFMGAGKSSVGKRLAEHLGLSVVDTDEVIEEDSGMKISEIFSRFGEPRFRELESEAVKRVSKLTDHVIVTGGGVVLKAVNIENLRKKGIIIYLHAAPETIYNRVKDETHRPLLQVADPLAKIRELLESRSQFYANNDIEVDTTNLSVDEVVEEIIQKIDSE